MDAPDETDFRRELPPARSPDESDLTTTGSLGLELAARGENPAAPLSTICQRHGRVGFKAGPDSLFQRASS